MTEKEHAVALANKVLDRPGADPDDDLAVLSRQLLREIERTNAIRDLLIVAANLTWNLLAVLPDDIPNVVQGREVFAKMTLALMEVETWQ